MEPERSPQNESASVTAESSVRGAQAWAVARREAEARAAEAKAASGSNSGGVNSLLKMLKRGAPAPNEEQKSKNWMLAKKKVAVAVALNGQIQDNRKMYGQATIDLEPETFGKEEDPEHADENNYYIDPDGAFRQSWDVAQALILLYLSLFTPYRVAYSEPAYGVEFWFEFLIDIYFYIDLVLNFFTAYEKEMDVSTVFVRDLPTIARNYLKTWFLLDVVACLPIDLVSRSVEGSLECSFKVNGCPPELETNNSGGQALKLLKLLRIFRLLKLLRLLRVSRLMVRYQDRLIYWDSALNMIKIVLLLSLVSHWLGCAYAVTYADKFSEDTSSIHRWLLSLYWAVQSITSVGYGDLTNDDPASLLVSIVTMIIGLFLCSWLMTNVLNALNPDSSSRRFHEKLQYVLSYLKGNKLPRGVATRVIQFYRKQNQNQFDERSVLDGLPVQLRKEIFDTLYMSTILKVPLFRNAPDSFVTEVCLRLSPVSIPEYRTVYVSGEIGLEMYIVAGGEVTVMPDRPGRSGRDLNKSLTLGNVSPAVIENLATVRYGVGSFFGEAAVIGLAKRAQTLVTLASTHLLSLNEEHFKDLQRVRPDVSVQLHLIYIERLARHSPHELTWNVQALHLDKAGLLDDERALVSDWRTRVKRVLADRTEEAVAMPSTGSGAMGVGGGVVSDRSVAALGEQVTELGLRLSRMENALGEILDALAPLRENQPSDNLP
eukprot:CAMPEP_0170135336 /NCGR_PEP_ID=MMETSP0033_2-20121228/2426_1 /TAXON_ID=195969 /ORGANISM="Dolichomastix tenuilepis, Strain CCMP3274" /LENGTH=714 /DNA_ID=CAMNT_0010370935 /DNA_START=50 /DNA_END=2194 /DNA_ORIENTATION=-